MSQLSEIPQSRRTAVSRDRCYYGEHHFRLFAARPKGCAVLQLSQSLKQSPRLLKKSHAVCREDCFSPAHLQEPDAKQVLELAYRIANGRLTDVEGLCSLSEPAMGNDSLKNPPLRSELSAVYGEHPTFGQMLAFQLISQAGKGEIAALSALLDRVEGKVTQKTSVEGSSDLVLRVIRADL